LGLRVLQRGLPSPYDRIIPASLGIRKGSITFGASPSRKHSLRG